MSAGHACDAGRRGCCARGRCRRSADADKEARGRVLVIAGSREIPGAAMLAGTAALRAGAGKLVIATGTSAAQSVALAVPEARVIALPETRTAASKPARCRRSVHSANAWMPR